ncbi:MAG: ComEC/Rec2 family competence protein, partial [Lachnospiraceae bacterium]
MRRRPICLLCLLFISILTILYLCGVPLRAAPKGAAEAEALLSTPCVAHLSGRVRSCKTQGDVTYLILENTQLLAIRYGNSQSSGTAPAAVSMKVCLGGVRIALSEQVHYAIGTQIRAAGTLAAIEGPTNPGQFDQKFYYELQGISWNLKKPVIQAAEQPAGNPLSTLLDNFREALALLGESLTARIAAIFPENAAATLAAMLTGDKSLLSKEAKTLYRIGGISHMLAISGLHISLLGMGLYHLLRKLRLPQRAAGLAAAIFLIAYAILTGGSVATVRAVLMFLLYLLAKRTHRVYDVPTALSVAAILLLIENPLYLLYAGFQLSFVAVLALAAFPGHGRLFSGLILYLITLPFTLWHYFTIPLYGILVNLVVVPLLPLVLGAGILALVGSYLLEALGLFAIGSLPLTLLTAPASWLLQAIEHLLGLTAPLPLASLPLGRPDIWQILLYVLLLAIFLYVLKKWRRTYRKYALLLALPLLIGIFLLRPAKTLALTFLDVGQGDGIFLELPGAAVLVDGGSSTVSSVGENRVQPFLAYSGIRRLDYLVATHADSDHTNGLREILEAVRDG